MDAEHLAALKAELPANAYRMRQMLDYIATHPGASMTEVRQACGVHNSPYKGVDALRRLMWRGAVMDHGRCNHARLYIWVPLDQPAGTYQPGHP
jgi:hypothetical protein